MYGIVRLRALLIQKDVKRKTQKVNCAMRLRALLIQKDVKRITWTAAEAYV